MFTFFPKIGWACPQPGEMPVRPATPGPPHPGAWGSTSVQSSGLHPGIHAAHGHQGFTVLLGSSDLLLHIISSAARILLPLTTVLHWGKRGKTNLDGGCGSSFYAGQVDSLQHQPSQSSSCSGGHLLGRRRLRDTWGAILQQAEVTNWGPHLLLQQEVGRHPV